MVGIIGLTRKEKSTIIPGVAIATALMPPLCTAGYELTRLDGALFVGSLYLFTINCVYIAFATSIVVWLMKIPRRKFVKHSVEKNVKRGLFLLAFLTMLPSIYIAFNLVKEELFTNYARKFVYKEFKFPETFIVDMKFFPKSRKIELVLIGEPLNQKEIDEMNQRLKDVGLYDASMIIHQAEDEKIKDSLLKKVLMQDKFYQSTTLKINKLEKEINQLKRDIRSQPSHR